MQLKEIKRNERIERKKRLEKHKKVIEDDIKDKATQEKTAKKNIVTKKRADRKAIKERQKAVTEKAMEDAHKGNIDSLEEGSKVAITKEERAKRFKTLHAVAQDMIKKWNESTNPPSDQH